MNNNKKNDNWFAKARSSKVIHELYIPVVNVFIEKKSTAPNSASVSIATKDKPATIAGRAAGRIIVYNVLKFVKPRFFPKSMKFCDWYKNEALAKIYTYANNENERDSITPSIPSNFGIYKL